MSLDIARARQETPGCAEVIHFNNAGAALMPRPVLEAITDHLELESRAGGYEAERRVASRFARIYESIAALLNCHRDEIALVENATRAWDMAFYAVPLRPGDRVLTSRNEYGSNYIAYLQVARRTGARVEVIPADESGQVSVEALRNMIDERVRLIAVTHVPTNGGLVNPAESIGQVAREAGVLYLLDACQSVGQMPVDVQAIGCDMLSATGRKYLRGPRGTGFLYVRRSALPLLEPPLLDLHAATWTAPDQYEIRPDARRFENWEMNVAGMLGLGAAVDYALGWDLTEIELRVVALAERLRSELGDIPGVAVHDLGQRQCGIVSFTAAGLTPDTIQGLLEPQGINVHVSGQSSTLLDMQARHLTRLVRASVHYYNTEVEVQRFCSAVRRLLGGT